jgi:hypothetical protein
LTDAISHFNKKSGFEPIIHIDIDAIDSRLSVTNLCVATEDSLFPGCREKPWGEKDISLSENLSTDLMGM